MADAVDHLNEEVLNRTSLRRALRSWHSTDRLGAHPLANLEIVEERRQARGYSATPTGRGLALRELLLAAFAELKPRVNPQDFLKRERRIHFILSEQYIHGRSPAWVQEQLAVSRRTYHNDQSYSLDRLCDILRQWQEQHRLRTGAAPEQSASIPENPMVLRGPLMAPPLPDYAIVGRSGLLVELRQRLLGGSERWLALTGLPGAGKTAIAIELAHDPEVLAHFRDGVLWADLGSQPNLLMHLGVWARALGLPVGTDITHDQVAALGAAMQRAIAESHILLVIDDAWCADDALALALGGPHCAHIITTRMTEVALSFAGKGITMVRELGPVDGLALLAQQAPDVVEAHPVEAQTLVQAVGGLPLALHLVGSHLRRHRSSHYLKRDLRRLQSLTQSVSALEHVAYPNGSDAEQLALEPRPLYAAISASERALHPAARRALRDLAVFPPKPNTFSEAAALAVTAVPRATLDTLVNCGLLENVSGERYTVHRAVVQYARLQGVSPQATRRLVGYCVHYAETHAGDDEALERELNNLRAALDAAHANHMQPELVQGAIALHPYLCRHGLYDLDEHYLQQAHAAVQAIGDAPREGRILCNLGIIALKQGELQGARSYLHQSLDMARAGDLHAVAAECWHHLGIISSRAGEYGGAGEYLHLALSAYRHCGNLKGEAAILLTLGATFGRKGDLVGAEGYLQRARVLARDVGDPRSEATILNNLGIIARKRNDYAAAALHYQGALDLYEEVGDLAGRAMVLDNLGLMSIDRGRYQEAAATLEEALAIHRELGDRWAEGIGLHNLGLAHIRHGDYPTGIHLCEQALDICAEISDQPGEAATLYELGRACVQVGDYDKADSCLQRALSMWRELGDLRNEMASVRELGVLHLRQGDDAEAQKWLEGALATLEQIDDPLEHSRWHRCFSMLHHRLGHDQRAVVHAHEAHQAAIQAGDRTEQGLALTLFGHILADTGRLAEAAAAYERALSLHSTLDEQHLLVEPRAGLARVGLAQGNLDLAISHVEQILSYLEDRESTTSPQYILAGAEDPARVYLTCYQVLQAGEGEDSRAQEVFQLAPTVCCRTGLPASRPGNTAHVVARNQ